ncbi:MAG: hypothetical protein KIS92_01540 [Planctomycetota bacterium]|nr:hypothetical protein [Planctomycetota bacterium]
MQTVTNGYARRRRGFLLVMVVGMLVLFLVLVVGFLSYTRGETEAVATIRDKNDGLHIFHSAFDWTVANICNDLLDSNNEFKAASGDSGAGLVSSTRSTGDACYKWWLRPYEKDSGQAPANIMYDEWIGMPSTYFTAKNIRAYYRVQVLDANAFINANDWNEDCNPTQCQMAHMMMDSFGDQYMENFRRWRDTGTWATGAYSAPLRYEEGWRMSTRTVRSTVWPNNTGISQITSSLSPTWVTNNSLWLTLHAADMHCLRTFPYSSGLPPMNQGAAQTIGPGNYYPPTPGEGFVTGTFDWNKFTAGTVGALDPQYAGTGWIQSNMQVGKYPWTICYSLYSYTDPDTGRSPVNVNTCWESGEQAKNSTQFEAPKIYTMEGVFNVESLRRIVRVGYFYMNGTDNVAYAIKADDVYAALAGSGAVLTLPTFANGTKDFDRNLALATIENLRLKLAYQYQETLCRYFTASYAHGDLGWPQPAPAPWPNLPRKYPRTSTANNARYSTVYSATIPNTEVSLVKYACTGTGYGATRFPYGLSTFRDHVRDDLLAMSNQFKNTAFGGTAEIAGDDGALCVSFDAEGDPWVPPGKLDKRTASAVYDNIVPGKVYLYASDPRSGVRDPLTELYDQQLGRDETQDDPYTTQTNVANNLGGYFTDNGTLKDSGIPIGSQTLRCKGKDLAAQTAPPGFYDYANGRVQTVPWRQRCFGPDWFSTELTTTSTTFYVIVTVRLYDLRTAQDIFNNQWGAVVEIAPDVRTETTAGYQGNTWPKGDPGDPSGTGGLGFYRGGHPARLKTATGFEWSMDGFPDGTIKKYRSDSSTQGVQTMHTISKQWADPRGATGDPAFSGQPSHNLQFYKAPNQNRKQVRIRTIWSLNNGAY